MDSGYESDDGYEQSCDRLSEAVTTLMSRYECLADLAQFFGDREDAMQYREGYAICMDFLLERYSVDVFIFKMLDNHFLQDLYAIKNYFPCYIRYLLNLCEKRN